MNDIKFTQLSKWTKGGKENTVWNKIETPKDSISNKYKNIFFRISNV